MILEFEKDKEIKEGRAYLLLTAQRLGGNLRIIGRMDLFMQVPRLKCAFWSVSH